jgi:hypothetical protein
MKPHVRASMAATALSHALGRKISSVYDYSRSGYLSIDADVRGNNLTGYDYEKSAHISGSLDSLYHYGESSHLELKPKGGGQYSGYDYGSSAHFDIRINGNSAELYDYSASAWYSYST